MRAVRLQVMVIHEAYEGCHQNLDQTLSSRTKIAKSEATKNVQDVTRVSNSNVLPAVYRVHTI